MESNTESLDTMTKILIVDDNTIIRKYISHLIHLEPDLKVCAEAWNEKSALQAIEDHKPDVVLVDISFGGNEAGIDLMKEISTRYSNLPMLALSLHEETLYVERALSAGARGYLMKQEAPDHLVDAIHQILSGNRYVHN